MMTVKGGVLWFLDCCAPCLPAHLLLVGCISGPKVSVQKATVLLVLYTAGLTSHKLPGCLQVPVEVAAKSFGVSERKVEGLQERTGWHAGMLAAFCERMDNETMDWTIMSRLILSVQVTILMRTGRIEAGCCIDSCSEVT